MVQDGLFGISYASFSLRLESWSGLEERTCDSPRTGLELEQACAEGLV